MPELPDIQAYLDALGEHVVGCRLESLRCPSPFVLRSVEPAGPEIAGLLLLGTSRIGKRIVLEFEGEHFALVHLMIAGRLRWMTRGAKLPGRAALAVFEFERGMLVLTEAGTKRRASLHLVRGASGLTSFERGGLDVLAARADQFDAALARENHTLKRALTDPRLFDGIGNAYSDEILHRARLSPLHWTSRLNAEERSRFYNAAQQVLREWIERLRQERGTRWPESVTAFRPEMAVHGRYGQACPACRSEVQRIVYADSECNYCARCQTGGRLLADRALSRLLHSDWPQTLEELEDLRNGLPGIRPP